MTFIVADAFKNVLKRLIEMYICMCAIIQMNVH